MTGYLFDLSTIDRSELFYTDIRSTRFKVMSAERFTQLPPPPKAFAPVAYAYAYAFKEPQPVGHGLGLFDAYSRSA